MLLPSGWARLQLCLFSPLAGQLYRRSNLQQMGREYGAELVLPHAVDVRHGECVFSSLCHRHDARSRRTGANSILWKFHISAFCILRFLPLIIIVRVLFARVRHVSSLSGLVPSRPQPRSDPSLSSFATLHPPFTRTHSLSSSTCSTNSHC